MLLLLLARRGVESGIGGVEWSVAQWPGEGGLVGQTELVGLAGGDVFLADLDFGFVLFCLGWLDRSAPRGTPRL
jgi:hypothetical protein